MADEPVVVPIDESTKQSLKETGELAAQASSAIGALGNIAGVARGAFNEFEQKVRNLGISLKTNQALTQDQTAAFCMLSTDILGTRKAFDNLQGVDVSGLDTFSKQWTDLEGILNNSAVGEKLQKLKQAATEMARAQSKSQEEFSQRMSQISKMTLTELSRFAKGMMESADNGLRLQNAMVQLAAKTGNLGAVFGAAGPNLSKINFLLQQQQKAVTDAAGATGLGADVVEQYYSQLGAVPKALQETVVGAGTAGKSVSMLTATIQLARGSGRAYSDVVQDLKFAFKELGMSGEPAVKFTARMSEISNKFGVELEDVQTALRGTADMFKMFGNNAEGAAKMYNQYLGQLQATGVSGKTALDMMSQLSAGIKGMGLAQKAFLSAQTGGAGGLMGGFQIEKMMREGKIDEVFDKVRETMNKQFGNIVTLDEAANSPQAAAQLTKQMAMLRQGPLGSFAKDDQSAMRILEAFKARDQGRPVESLKDTIVQDTMKDGIDLQQQSVTELTRIRELIQGNQGFANVANLTTMQQATTARIGAPMQNEDYNAEHRTNLRQAGLAAAEASGRTTIDMAGDINSRILRDRAGVQAVHIVDSYKKLIDEMGPAVTAPLNKIAELFKSGDDGKAREVLNAQLQSIKQQREDATNAPAMVRAAQLQQLDQREAALKAGYGALAASGGTAGDAPIINPQFNPNIDVTDLGLAGDNVRAAAGRSVTRTRPGTHTHTPAPTSGTNQSEGGHMGTLTVQVEGYCLDCGDKIRNNKHVLATSPGTNMSK